MAYKLYGNFTAPDEHRHPCCKRKCECLSAKGSECARCSRNRTNKAFEVAYAARRATESPSTSDSSRRK